VTIQRLRSLSALHNQALLHRLVTKLGVEAVEPSLDAGSEHSDIKLKPLQIPRYVALQLDVVNPGAGEVLCV